MKQWILVDIGCLECGEPSTVLGFYVSREQCESTWKDYSEQPDTRWGRHEWSGQHSCLIQEVVTLL